MGIYRNTHDAMTKVVGIVKLSVKQVATSLCMSIFFNSNLTKLDTNYNFLNAMSQFRRIAANIIGSGLKLIRQANRPTLSTSTKESPISPTNTTRNDDYANILKQIWYFASKNALVRRRDPKNESP